jgi:hypothetical protein
VTSAERAAQLVDRLRLIRAIRATACLAAAMLAL